MIIIPDIHGRTFWKTAVRGRENEKIIFQGDYTDPYPFEGIDPTAGLQSLRDVIDFKLQHRDNVVLLLGNHDLSYVSTYLTECRHDDANHFEIRDLILKNISLFKIAHEERIGYKRFVFTHAGILPGWLENNEPTLGHIGKGHEVEILNQLFESGDLYPALGDISFDRGGNHDAGSCVWADVNEHLYCTKSPNAIYSPDMYQVFGHSLLLSGQPIITSHFACLDCREAFKIDDSGQICKSQEIM